MDNWSSYTLFPRTQINIPRRSPPQWQVQEFSQRNILCNRYLFLMASLSPSSTILCRVPNGICNPIPDITKSSITSCECKFIGTLVFNHLPPSNYERQTSQSTSAGLRRLNRGSCCTPKFVLSYFPRFSLILVVTNTWLNKNKFFEDK